MHMFSSYSWRYRSTMLRLSHLPGILELSPLSLEALFDALIIAVLDLTVLNGSNIMAMLLREDFLVLDWLNSGMMVVLVYLTVNGCCGLLVLSPGYMLILNCWVDSLVDCGVMLAIL